MEQIEPSINLHIYIHDIYISTYMTFLPSPNMKQRCFQVDGYSLEANEIYFDRDPGSFNSILNFYRTGRLHVIDEVCTLEFAEDLEFWMIKEINLEVCCIDKFNSRRDHIIGQVEQINIRKLKFPGH